jgi:hypothetical protein
MNKKLIGLIWGFLFALTAPVAQATQIIHGGTLGLGVFELSNPDNPNPGLLTFYHDYDAYNFSVASDNTKVVIDAGGSLAEYTPQTDTLLTLFSGSGIDPNTPATPLAFNDDFSQTTAPPRIATGVTITVADAFLDLILDAGDYTLFVTHTAGIPGRLIDTSPDPDRAYEFFEVLPTENYTGSYSGEGYRLTISGATLTRIPEPGTFALLALGIAGICFQQRRRLPRN